MSEHIDTRAGWTPVEGIDLPRGPYRRLVELDPSGHVARSWVRELSLSPLPTEPGYYVADDPNYGDTVVVELLNRPPGQWVDAGDRKYLDDAKVQQLGPLTRLEPREDTASAVLSRVRDVWPLNNQSALDDIATQFGAQP